MRKQLQMMVEWAATKESVKKNAQNATIWSRRFHSAMIEAFKFHPRDFKK